MSKLTNVTTTDIAIAKYVNAYTHHNLIEQIKDQLDVIVQELAEEIVSRYEVESIFREEAKNRLDKGKIILTVVMRAKQKK